MINNPILMLNGFDHFILMGSVCMHCRHFFLNYRIKLMNNQMGLKEKKNEAASIPSTTEIYN